MNHPRNPELQPNVVHISGLQPADVLPHRADTPEATGSAHEPATAALVLKAALNLEPPTAPEPHPGTQIDAAREARADRNTNYGRMLGHNFPVDPNKARVIFADKHYR